MSSFLWNWYSRPCCSLGFGAREVAEWEREEKLVEWPSIEWGWIVIVTNRAQPWQIDGADIQ
jgi:hypothetical protein